MLLPIQILPIPNSKLCNFSSIQKKKKKLNYDPQVYVFDSESNKKVTLERPNFIKYLGLLIDENLSWKTRIHSVANKISNLNNIGLIARLRHITIRCVCFFLFIGREPTT